MKKLFGGQFASSEYGQPFTSIEMDKALAKMKRKGCEGPDDIPPPPFLQELDPLAKAELLAIFNQSYTQADCPQMSRTATTIPLLKAKQLPSDLKSYRNQPDLVY